LGKPVPSAARAKSNIMREYGIEPAPERDRHSSCVSCVDSVFGQNGQLSPLTFTWSGDRYLVRSRISISFSPSFKRRSMSGKKGPNHANNTRLVQLPKRSHTTAGVAGSPMDRVTRSSSLVITVHPPLPAKFKMLPSSDSRSPTSRTGVAGKPCSPSHRASAGGSWASTRNRTAQAATRTVWSR
jgi:hypothetical protein